MILRLIYTSAVHCGRSKLREIHVYRHISIQSRLCSTTSTKSRETFDEFRAREEQKEKEASTEATTQEILHRNDENDPKVLAVKELILNAALGYVPTHGWSKKAIAKGAESVNYSSISVGLFPKNGIELINYFHKICNQKLVEHLKLQASETETDSAKFARNAIEIRLRMLIPYLQQWPQALGIMALPPNTPTSLTHVLRLADDICYYAGDRSVDFNWYTRRIGLASIYKATELHMLQDNSQDFEKTWKFLDRRIEEAKVLHDFLVKSENTTVHIKNAIGSTISTAGNILGLNFDRR